MTTFMSFAHEIRELLMSIVASNALHAKWLNTLSYLENTGARKIAACEHSTLVKEEMLKHASEEFRHAHYLKRQIKKLSNAPMDTYSTSFILGGTTSLQYLAELDLKASRYLKSKGFVNHSLKDASYLLVTYAIESRAEELYLIYDEILKRHGSEVTVKSILLEEKEHLNEMKKGLNSLPSGRLHAEQICEIEGHLCKKWLGAMMQENFSLFSLITSVP